MRVAVASNGLDVSPYFESCGNYNYFTIEQGKMRGYRNLPILPQQKISHVDILKELEIDTLIVGCLKDTSRTRLEAEGLTVLCGAKGNAKQVVEDFMNDTFIACDGQCDENRKVCQEQSMEEPWVSFG